MGRLYADFVHAGVAGFWNDMNEPAVFEVREKTMPLDNRHRIEEPGFALRAATHAEIHNVYGMLNSRATYEGLLKLTPGERPFVLTRASYAGGQRYAATWTGDNSSSWNHLRLCGRPCSPICRSAASRCRAPMSGASPVRVRRPELLTRWIELGAFTPLFRDHTDKGKPAQEPWAGGREHEAIRRHYIEERYRLLPYLYGLAKSTAAAACP